MSFNQIFTFDVSHDYYQQNLECIVESIIIVDDHYFLIDVFFI